MASPFQVNDGAQASGSSNPPPFAELEALAIASSSSMAEEAKSEPEAGMEASDDESDFEIEPSEELGGEVNLAVVCTLGQRTVHDIVAQTIKLFSILKSMQLPLFDKEQVAEQEKKRAEVEKSLKSIRKTFKKLNRLREQCFEDGATMQYSQVEADSLIPFADQADSRQEEKKPSERVKKLTEEQLELIEAINLKNRQIKESIDLLRSVMWDISTMLATA